MRDEPARDAVRNALDRDVPYLGPEGREHASRSLRASSSIRASHARVASYVRERAGGARHPAHHHHQRDQRRAHPNGAYVVNAAGRGWAYGASPAAAIHALNAKLEERADG
jgi:hypothetical protein